MAASDQEWNELAVLCVSTAGANRFAHHSLASCHVCLYMTKLLSSLLSTASARQQTGYKRGSINFRFCFSSIFEWCAMFVNTRKRGSTYSTEHYSVKSAQIRYVHASRPMSCDPWPVPNLFRTRVTYAHQWPMQLYEQQQSQEAAGDVSVPSFLSICSATFTKEPDSTAFTCTRR